MPDKPLLYELKEGNVAVVTLNRPHRLNALSSDLVEEFMKVLDDAERNDDVRALVLTGSPRPDGRPCFSAGKDLKEMNEEGEALTDEDILRTMWLMAEDFDKRQPLIYRYYTLTKPTIAAIDGICTAGGLELALCSDLRVASTTARISDLHMKNLGMLGGSGLQTFLPRAVGLMRAKEIAWLNEEMNGEEALRIGFVCRVFPPEQLLEGVLGMARKLASHPPLAMKFSKMTMNAALNQGTYDSLRFSGLSDVILRYFHANDFAGALEAFSQRK
ncbi:MAG: enoyl-CoA hydratase/isomerase family protein [Chloroflexi bacterium]|nr:enoyl-CoA hydratase/isomerase family protein [Chloroflexota bacterium]